MTALAGAVTVLGCRKEDAHEGLGDRHVGTSTYASGMDTTPMAGTSRPRLGFIHDHHPLQRGL